MISADRPRHTPLLVHADEHGVVLHDPHTGSTHRLNGVARQLWELCDGSRDRAALAKEIAARFGIRDRCRPRRRRCGACAIP
jgi:hypothetical protein